MNKGETRRLFFALWPDEVTRTQLATLATSCAPEKIGRSVAAANLHITLVFLGDVSCDRHACVEEACSEIDGESFHLCLDRLGYWHRPQVLWVGADTCPGPLLRLVDAMRDILEKRCGFEPETRPFVPHLTLRRKVRRRLRLPDVDVIDWRVDGYALIESCFVPGGVQYTVLRTWPLQ